MKITKLIFYTIYYVIIYATYLFYVTRFCYGIIILETKEIIIMFNTVKKVINFIFLNILFYIPFSYLNNIHYILFS